MTPWTSEMVELPLSPDGPRPREPTLEDAAGGLADNADTVDGLDDLLLHRRLEVQMFGHAEPVLVGEFEVAHRFGAGGMGIVYAARDPKLQRDVALKLVKAPDPRGHARILREAQALAKLAHPNVVTVHAVGEHQGRVFVAMELVHGETLRDWIETERPLEDIARVFLQAGQGLAAAHAAGLVHRDFKPDNVIVADRTEEGEGYGVRVVDFGLAREGGPVDPAAVEASAEPITRTGDLGGTFGYMAYEQLCGGQLDARSDVFSFCVSLYEALHGPRPIVADTIEQMTQALRDGAPPDPRRPGGHRAHSSETRARVARGPTPADRRGARAAAVDAQPPRGLGGPRASHLRAIRRALFTRRSACGQRGRTLPTPLTWRCTSVGLPA